jgi:hypothetical protein
VSDEKANGFLNFVTHAGHFQVMPQPSPRLE